MCCLLGITACLTVGGHISLLVSRPVWYAASFATARSPFIFHSQPWNVWAPSVTCSYAKRQSRKYLGKVHTVQALWISSLEFIRNCGKLRKRVAAIRDKVGIDVYSVRRNLGCQLSTCFYLNSVDSMLLVFFPAYSILPCCCQYSCEMTSSCWYECKCLWVVQ